MRYLVATVALVAAIAAHAAQSTTALFVPYDGMPQRWGSINDGTPIGELWCENWVPSLGITGADNVALYALAVDADSYFMVGIYREDGLVKYMEAVVNNVGTLSKQTFTVGSFTLWAGTEYRFCWCVEDASGLGTVGYAETVDGSGSETVDLMRAIGTDKYGYDADGCDGRTTMPDTVPDGVLSDPTLDRPPPVVLLSTEP